MLIEKDGTVLNVTRGAFLSLFQSQGWYPSEKSSTTSKKQQDSETFMSPQPTKKKAKAEEKKESASEIPFGNMLNEYEEDGDEDYDLVLEDMTIKELIEYAAERDLDIEGLTKKSQIIKAIREQLGA